MPARFRAIVALVLLVAVLGAGYWVFTQYRAGKEYNRITNDLMNQERYVEAGEAFEAMLPSAPAGLREQARKQAGECFRRQGNRVEQSLKEQARWLTRAKAVDPSLTFTADEERVIKTAGR